MRQLNRDPFRRFTRKPTGFDTLAGEIKAAYEQDRVEAKSKYEGTVMEFTGIFDNITELGFLGTLVQIKDATDGSRFRVNAVFDADSYDAGKLNIKNIGKTITISGRFTYMQDTEVAQSVFEYTDIRLEHCTLVKIK